MSTPEVGATELPPVSVPVDVVMGDVGHGDTGVDAAILNGAPPTTGSGKDEFKEGPVNAQSLVLDGGEPSGAGDGDGEHDAGGTDDQTAHTAGAKRRKMNTPHSVYLPDDRGKSTAAPLSKDTDRSAYAVYPMDVVPAAPPAPPDPVAEEPVKKKEKTPKQPRPLQQQHTSHYPKILPRQVPSGFTNEIGRDIVAAVEANRLQRAAEMAAASAAIMQRESGDGVGNPSRGVTHGQGGHGTGDVWGAVARESQFLRTTQTQPAAASTKDLRLGRVGVVVACETAVDRAQAVLSEQDPTDTDGFFVASPAERCVMLIKRKDALQAELERAVASLVVERAVRTGLEEALAVANTMIQGSHAAGGYGLSGAPAGGGGHLQQEYGSPDDCDPAALAVLNGDSGETGAVVATKLGPAFFANEDDTPFAIGRSLCGDPIEDAKTGRLDLSVFVEVADKSKELADKQEDAESAKPTARTCGAVVVALNERRLPGLKLRSKLHEGTRLWLTPGSLEEKKHVMKTLVHTRCAAVLAALEKHECAVIFTEPVDHVALGLPDYPSIVKHPMDLGTVAKKLENNEYDLGGPSQFVTDVQLTFHNCLAYNPVGTDARQMGEIMLRELKQKWIASGF